MENESYYASSCVSYPTMAARTETEQAVTVVYININTKRVELKRIGAVTPNIVTGYNYN